MCVFTIRETFVLSSICKNVRVPNTPLPPTLNCETYLSPFKNLMKTKKNYLKRCWLSEDMDMYISLQLNKYMIDGIVYIALYTLENIYLHTNRVSTKVVLKTSRDPLLTIAHLLFYAILSFHSFWGLEKKRFL